jgi:Ser/Thr protein kinase RdoA (MazF antagonist)
MITATQIADRYDIGQARSELVAVPGGNTHRLYRIETTAGSWAVKLLNRSQEQWWIDAYERSVQLEDAAFVAGVNCPRYVATASGNAGGLVELEDGEHMQSVRVYEWIDGVKPSAPIYVELMQWVAATMVKLSGLQLPGGELADTYRTFSADEWQSWIAEAKQQDLRCAASLSDALPMVLEAQQVVMSVFELNKTLQLLHRDVTPHNVLMSAQGPMLLDWDSAGADVPWPDFVRTLWRFAGFPERPIDGDLIRVGLDTYLLHGGEVDDDKSTAFIGLANGILGSLSYFLWRALGHRNVTVDERMSSDDIALDLVSQLDQVMHAIPQWKRLL